MAHNLIYLDNIVVFGSTFDEPLQRVEVLNSIRTAGLKLSQRNGSGIQLYILLSPYLYFIWKLKLKIKNTVLIKSTEFQSELVCISGARREI